MDDDMYLTDVSWAVGYFVLTLLWWFGGGLVVVVVVVG